MGAEDLPTRRYDLVIPPQNAIGDGWTHGGEISSSRARADGGWRVGTGVSKRERGGVLWSGAVGVGGYGLTDGCRCDVGRSTELYVRRRPRYPVRRRRCGGAVERDRVGDREVLPYLPLRTNVEKAREPVPYFVDTSLAGVIGRFRPSFLIYYAKCHGVWHLFPESRVRSGSCSWQLMILRGFFMINVDCAEDASREDV